MKPQNHPQRHALCLCTFLLAALPLAAQAGLGGQTDDKLHFELTLGSVQGTQSYFKGVLPQSRTDPLIVIDLSKGPWFLSTTNGLGYLFVDSKEFSAGVSANYMLGRKQSHASAYAGMGDVDHSISAYGVFEWRPIKDAVTVYGNVARSLRSQDGTLAQLGVTLGFPIYGKLAGFFDYNSNWADSNYTQTYYGVTAGQSVSSGYAPYAAGGGRLSSTPSLGLYYPINANLALAGYVGRTRLFGAAADSPVVQGKPSQPVSALAVNYKF